MQIGGVARMSGEVRPLLIRKVGFYDGGDPIDMPRSRKLHGVYLETMLRGRLAAKGFYRGLIHGSGVGAIGRVRASIIRANGGVEHYGLLSTKFITNAAVTFLRDDWNSGASDINLMNFHGAGTGTNAENVTDTALQTESTTALNPDSTRATGTRSVPSSNVFRTVGTLTFDAVAAITEHGILSQAATGGGTLWDRSVFSALNVVSGDSIQFTYDCTLSAGG